MLGEILLLGFLPLLIYRKSKKIFYISLFFIFLFINNVFAVEEWSITEYDGFSYAAVSGEIQHGDKLIFILDPNDNCERVTNTFSFYTWQDPGDFNQLIDRNVPLILNGKAKLTAKVISIKPFLNGNLVIFSLGAYPIKDYIAFLYKFYKEIKKYEIEIVDGLNFEAKKYFDITVNNWKLENLLSSITEANKICKNINKKKILYRY